MSDTYLRDTSHPTHPSYATITQCFAHTHYVCFPCTRYALLVFLIRVVGSFVLLVSRSVVDMPRVVRSQNYSVMFMFHVL